MSDDRITKEDQEPERIELWNMAIIRPHWWLPWLKVFYFDCPQFLSYNLLDKYGVNPFLFEFKESDGCKYIGVKCRVWIKDMDNFFLCMHELQRNMMICGYSDYKEFCREWQKQYTEEDDTNE